MPVLTSDFRVSGYAKASSLLGENTPKGLEAIRDRTTSLRYNVKCADTFQEIGDDLDLIAAAAGRGDSVQLMIQSKPYQRLLDSYLMVCSAASELLTIGSHLAFFSVGLAANNLIISMDSLADKTIENEKFRAEVKRDLANHQSHLISHISKKMPLSAGCFFEDRWNAFLKYHPVQCESLKELAGFVREFNNPGNLRDPESYPICVDFLAFTGRLPGILLAAMASLAIGRCSQETTEDIILRFLEFVKAVSAAYKTLHLLS